MALIVTSAFKVLYHMSGKILALVPFISCMAGKVFMMTHVLLEYHIKVKKFGGAFKAIPMHYHNGMSDSDLNESKDKRKLSYIQTKSRNYKHDSQKYSNIKNSVEFLKVQQYEEL